MCQIMAEFVVLYRNGLVGVSEEDTSRESVIQMIRYTNESSNRSYYVDTSDIYWDVGVLSNPIMERVIIDKLVGVSELKKLLRSYVLTNKSLIDFVGSHHKGKFVAYRLKTENDYSPDWLGELKIIANLYDVEEVILEHPKSPNDNGSITVGTYDQVTKTIHLYGWQRRYPETDEVVIYPGELVRVFCHELSHAIQRKLYGDSDDLPFSRNKYECETDRLSWHLYKEYFYNHMNDKLPYRYFVSKGRKR